MKPGDRLMNIGFFSELLLIGTWYVWLETTPPDMIAWMYYVACGAFVLVVLGFLWAVLGGRVPPPKEPGEDE